MASHLAVVGCAGQVHETTNRSVGDRDTEQAGGMDDLGGLGVGDAGDQPDVELVGADGMVPAAGLKHGVDEHCLQAIAVVVAQVALDGDGGRTGRRVQRANGEAVPSARGSVRIGHVQDPRSGAKIVPPR
ncbi:unannotated protein [freshwater metagenome]|uniref:Unannotated protein n=1 Tax=freshwater metagenome TaxID=449393 RepID=A0A6J7FJ52_9ZZZZ